jgi:DNA-directed RNA polymerase subunit RPC12/RpoP
MSDEQSITCPHCGDITEQPQPLLAEYTCGKCDQPFSARPARMTDSQSSDFQRKCREALDFIKKEFLDHQQRAHGGSGEKKFDPQVIEEIGADLDKLFKRHAA